jgi:hypothetical protein
MTVMPMAAADQHPRGSAITNPLFATATDTTENAHKSCNSGYTTLLRFATAGIAHESDAKPKSERLAMQMYRVFSLIPV